MDALAALALQVEWGVDEALGDAPIDRRRDRPPPTPALPTPAPPPLTPAPPARAAVDLSHIGTLAGLRDAIAASDGGGLRGSAMSLVTEDGNPGAGLVVVGAAPSDDDDREGRPFSGARGVQLDLLFGSVGLDRGAMLLTMLVPWRPPGRRDPYAAELQACLPFFWRRIALVRPRRLVLLGGAVTAALGLGRAPIGRLRGRWVEVEAPGLPPIPALPMRAIEDSFKTTIVKRETWADLLALRADIDRAGQGESRVQD